MNTSGLRSVLFLFLCQIEKGVTEILRGLRNILVKKKRVENSGDLTITVRHITILEVKITERFYFAFFLTMTYNISTSVYFVK
jgi:hypothetical protein